MSIMVRFDFMFDVLYLCSTLFLCWLGRLLFIGIVLVWLVIISWCGWFRWVWVIRLLLWCTILSYGVVFVSCCLMWLVMVRLLWFFELMFMSLVVRLSRFGILRMLFVFGVVGWIGGVS